MVQLVGIVCPHPSDLGPSVPSARPGSHGIAGAGGRRNGRKARNYLRNLSLIPGGARFNVHMFVCMLSVRVCVSVCVCVVCVCLA